MKQLLDHSVRRDRLRAVSSARRLKSHRLEHAGKCQSNVICLWTIHSRDRGTAGLLHGGKFARTEVKGEHANVSIIPARGCVADLARRNGHPRRVRMAPEQTLWRTRVASDHFACVPAERTARHGSVPFPLFCFTLERTHGHESGFARFAAERSRSPNPVRPEGEKPSLPSRSVPVTTWAEAQTVCSNSRVRSANTASLARR